MTREIVWWTRICASFEKVEKVIEKLRGFLNQTYKWTTGASFTTERVDHSSVVLNGKIYLTGGKAYGPIWLNDTQIFDPKTKKWIKGASFKTGRQGHASVVLDGKIYLMGGQDKDYNYLNDMQIFDPKIGYWTIGAPFENGRSGHTVVALGGKIYLMGGYDDKNNLNDMQIFDPKIGYWIKGASFKTGREGHTSVALGGKIYLMGGIINGTSLDDDIDLNDTQIFDPEIGEWTIGKSFKTARYGHTSVVSGGKIYLMGGLKIIETNRGNFSYHGPTELNDTQIFDPKTKKWFKGASFEIGRYWHSSVVLDDKICLIGGNNGYRNLDEMIVYDLNE